MTRLSEIQDRVDAATPGPWPIGLFTGYHKPADATFIAHARADVPLLLAEVKKLTGERDEQNNAAIRMSAGNAALSREVTRYREALTKIVNGDDYISSQIAYDALSEGEE
jgi:hypothetical protein